MGGMLSDYVLPKDLKGRGPWLLCYASYLQTLSDVNRVAFSFPEYGYAHW